MNLLPAWLREWLRSPCAPLRRRNPRTQLTVELLEDRLIPSANPLTDPTYAAWRQHTFRVDDAAVTRVAAALVVHASSAINASFGSLIGLDQVLGSTSYRGNGYSVAVIDTGINYNDPNLGGGWGKRVVAGYDFVNNDSNPMDDNGHGTFVASEIGSSSTSYSGVAPNVNLIALKVLDSTGSGTYGNVQSALDWVIAHQAQYHIAAINLSLGSGNFTMNPYSFLESEFTTIKAQGVFLAVAAGNDYYSNASAPGLAYPAISTNVVSVGAVWDGNFGSVAWASGARDYSTAPDKIASFSQRASTLSILAPGAIITGDSLSGAYIQMAGTSMASPVVAGAAVLLHQALVNAGLAANANQSYILHLMQSTGKTIVDANNGTDNVGHTGLSFKRLNLVAALNAIQPAVPRVATVPDQTISVGQSVTVTVTTSDSPGRIATYTARPLTADQDAYLLSTSYKLAYTGDYSTNRFGMNEKWLWSYLLGGRLVCLLPDGSLRRYDPAGTKSMLGDANLLGRVDPAYYNDPLTLIKIKQPASMVLPATARISGSKLTVTPNNGFTGTIYVVIVATDGVALVRKPFIINVPAGPSVSTAPTIAPISDQSINAGGHATVTVQSRAANGSPANWTAQVMTAAQQATAVAQQLKLSYAGQYWTNFYGMNEKWLWSSALGGVVVCILPDGTLRRYDAAGTNAMLGAANLLGRVSFTYYANPQLLIAAASANAPAAPPASLAISGSQLTVTPSESFSGDLVVVITATDGSFTTKKSFLVNVH